MKVRTSLIAAAILGSLTAGGSAAYLSEDIYGAARHGPSNRAALKSDEGVPQNLVTALKSDEGVPQNLVTAMKSDDGVPQSLIVA